MIKNCGCTSANKAALYQDSKYGKGVRVFTESTKGVPMNHVRGTCTVCGANKTFPLKGE